LEITKTLEAGDCTCGGIQTELWPDGHTGRRSGSLSGKRCEADGRHDGKPLGGDRVISPMAMAAAGLTFFFDVGEFAAGGHLAIAADDASAGKRRESEKPNETHHAVLPAIRRANRMPLKILSVALITARHIGSGARIDNG
jgi:hypothetical protein